MNGFHHQLFPCSVLTRDKGGDGIALRYLMCRFDHIENTRRFTNDPVQVSGIIGESPGIHNVLGTAHKIAQRNSVTTLITGENGTGKELIAREIHERSDRSAEIMVSVDLGAVPDTLFESEIFGHVKGAFTDAHSDRLGKIAGCV